MLEKIIVLLVVGVVAMMFFGNRLPQVLGDFGRGLRAFKDGLNEGNDGDDAGSAKPAVSKKISSSSGSKKSNRKVKKA